MRLNIETFGYLDGEKVKRFILSNDNGIVVKIINYGGIITSIEMPDANGNIDNIVCGFEDLETYLSKEYLDNYPYFGGIIGRSANRIKDGNLVIEGKNYQLAKNNGGHHLHGGNMGFDKRIWKSNIIENCEEIGVELTYLSPHLEENYPGNLNVSCIYTLNNKNELGIEFFAKTDRKTIVNLTNHTYFNLTGGREDILNHELKLNSNKITETDDNHLPTGKFVSVKDTSYDFLSYKKIGEDFHSLSKGYDDNFVLNNGEDELKFAACLREATTSRQIEIFTTQAGIQLYTGYWIPELMIESKKKFGKYSGVALETQHFPDAVNHKNFPSIVLNPDDVYNQKTVYKFGLF